jgi:hypothetical protein
MGAGWRLGRLSWLIALTFWWQFVASLAWVMRALTHCVLKVMSLCNIARRSTHVPFRRVWGDVRREFMQPLFAALHGTLGSQLRDALEEGTVGVVAYLILPRAQACGVS